MPRPTYNLVGSSARRKRLSVGLPGKMFPQKNENKEGQSGPIEEKNKENCTDAGMASKRQ